MRLFLAALNLDHSCMTQMAVPIKYCKQYIERVTSWEGDVQKVMVSEASCYYYTSLHYEEDYRKCIDVSKLALRSIEIEYPNEASDSLFTGMSAVIAYIESNLKISYTVNKVITCCSIYVAEDDASLSIHIEDIEDIDRIANYSTQVLARNLNGCYEKEEIGDNGIPKEASVDDVEEKSMSEDENIIIDLHVKPLEREEDFEDRIALETASYCLGDGNEDDEDNDNEKDGQPNEEEYGRGKRKSKVNKRYSTALDINTFFTEM